MYVFLASICLALTAVVSETVQDSSKPSRVNALASLARAIALDSLNPAEEAKLRPMRRGEGTKFGVSVSISGEKAVVGAWGGNPVGPRAGSACVFARTGTTWNLEDKVVAMDGEKDDQFGTSVAISGNTVVVGARYDDDSGIDSGSAYVFVREGTSWKQQAKLIANDGRAGDRFGVSVAISGNTVVVGACGDDDAVGEDCGSAYVFVRRKKAWSQGAKLTASDEANGDRFGGSVAISGDTVIVGARRHDLPKRRNAGSAYVFLRGRMAWTQKAKLTPPDAGVDMFGGSVSISGDTVAVAGRSCVHGSSPWRVYVFERDGGEWSVQAKLSESGTEESSASVCSVSVSDRTVIVGAHQHWEDEDKDAGAVYVYLRSGTTWTRRAKLTAQDSASHEGFGWSVSNSGDTVVVGAPGGKNARIWSWGVWPEN